MTDQYKAQLQHTAFNDTDEFRIDGEIRDMGDLYFLVWDGKGYLNTFRSVDVELLNYDEVNREIAAIAARNNARVQMPQL